MNANLKIALWALFMLILIGICTGSANAQNLVVFVQDSSRAVATCEKDSCALEVDKSIRATTLEIVSHIPARMSSELEYDGNVVAITYEGREYIITGETVERDTTFTNAAQMRGYLKKLLDEYIGNR